MDSSSATVTVWSNDSLNSLYSFRVSGQAQLAAAFVPILAIEAGDHSRTIALRADGTVRAWGHAEWEPDTAAPPAGLSQVTAVAAGLNHFIALKSDRMVVSWGCL
jgi:alpha-tubulin suppressor-like RCC1 family protein